MTIIAHPDLDEAVVFELDGWSVRNLTLSPEKIAYLWGLISRFRTLFSDLTKGDINNFLRFVTEPYSIWLELWQDDQIVGLVCFTRMERVVDTDAHIIFFDRETATKVPLCKEILRWVFAEFPLQRVSVDIPHFYYATVRLVKAIGFRQEGERRNAVLIGGRWANVSLFGITRAEVEAL